MSQSGIYTITSPSGGRYVGSAVHFGARWSVHKHHLARGTHHNVKLQNAAKKYGVEALRFEPLLFCDRDDLIWYEQIAIDAIRPRYNVAPRAGNSLGYKHTAETKAKFHLRVKATMTDEVKAKIGAAFRGKTLTEEHRAKVRAANVGAKRSEEARASMRAAQLGKKQSPETIAKRVEKLRGKPRPPEVLAKMNAARDAAAAARRAAKAASDV